MALRTSLVAQPHLYMGDTQGRPLDAGKVYFGEPNKDPELYPINVFYDEALTLAAPQPIRTMGGFMNANGQMVEIYAAETTYSVKVLDGYGRQVFYQDDMSSTSTSASVSTKLPYPNAVNRTQASKNAETVSIEDFGASTSNADNTTQINNALQYAKDNKAQLNFPQGVYKVSGNVPLIHEAELAGKGALQRGLDIFYINPDDTQTNTIYISDGAIGDGLTRDSTMRTTSINPTLRNLGGRTKSGNYRIVFKSGTHTGKGVRTTNIPSFKNPLLVEGELGSNGEVLTVWDGTDSIENYAWRMDLNCLPQRVNFKNMRLINWVNDVRNSGGIVAWGSHQVVSDNLHVDNCRIGLWASRNSFLRVIGGTINNCTHWGIGCQYNSSIALGESSARTKITNCGIGLHLGRLSIAHNDYVDYEGNGYDVNAVQNSRIAHVDPTFKNWIHASHYLQTGAINEGTYGGSFDPASHAVGKPVYYTEGTAISDNIKGQALELLHTSYIPTNLQGVSGTTPTELSRLAGFGALTDFPRYFLYQNTYFQVRSRMRVQGTVSAGSVMRISGNGTSASGLILEIALPSGVFKGVVEFVFELRVDGRAYAYATVTSTLGVNFSENTLPTTVMNTLRSDPNERTKWAVYLQLSGASDDFKYLSQKTWTTF